MSDWFGKDVFKLGFGLMRLPHNADGSVDMPQVCEMVDRFITAGGTYFDTAYVYDMGKSEAAFKEAVVESRDNKIHFYETMGYVADYSKKIVGETFTCYRMAKDLN